MPEGDPRVHLVMNLVLSATFVFVTLWGLDFIGAVEFTYLRLAVGTVVLMAITHLLV